MSGWGVVALWALLGCSGSAVDEGGDSEVVVDTEVETDLDTEGVVPAYGCDDACVKLDGCAPDALEGHDCGATCGAMPADEQAALFVCVEAAECTSEAITACLTSAGGQPTCEEAATCDDCLVLPTCSWTADSCMADCLADADCYGPGNPAAPDCPL